MKGLIYACAYLGPWLLIGGVPGIVAGLVAMVGVIALDRMADAEIRETRKLLRQVDETIERSRAFRKSHGY